MGYTLLLDYLISHTSKYFFLATDTSNYWILGTDYTSYSFVVNCVNVNATHSSESYWLFGRVYPLPQAARDRADEIASRVLDTSRIRSVIQGIPECILD